MNNEPVFVAREHEIERLGMYLDRAIEGRGQVCFVTGEAGSGKTALVTEFTRQAQEKHSDLVVVCGQCNAHTGSGDPYLPFQEILQQLTGLRDNAMVPTIAQDNSKQLRNLLSLSGRALVEVGPDLVGLFLPGAGLVARLAAFAFDESRWGKKLQKLVHRSLPEEATPPLDIQQSHIFEQFANVFQRMAEKVPMILFLDDLHWSDTASTELFFHLSRRLRENRIMIVGTYRPDEVILGRFSKSTGQIERHPLEKTVPELMRYFGDILVKLGEETESERQRFINAYIDTESNLLDDTFRQKLMDHTEGHPLFTIELLRDMQERGDLIRDDQKRWIEGTNLDWNDLPARIEGVMEERFGRLSDELLEELMVGSVEGERFTIEVIARVQDIDSRQLFQRFSRELERRQRLIIALGVNQINDQRLYHFQFSHNLFQVYLYNKLSETERIFLHEAIGIVLETLYSNHLDEIAVQLARHFQEARIQQKACEYLLRAGKKAARKYANTEALDYFNQILALGLEAKPDVQYQSLLARIYIFHMQGARQDEAKDLIALTAVAKSLDAEDGTSWRRAEVASWQCRHEIATGEFAAAIKTAQHVVDLIQTMTKADFEVAAIHPSILEATAYWQWGRALWRQGVYKDACHKLEQAREKASGSPKLEAGILSSLGAIANNQGDFLDAVRYTREALDYNHKSGDRLGEGRNHINLGAIAYNQGDFNQAFYHFKQALEISSQIGDRSSIGKSLNNLGVIAEDQGDYNQARHYYQQVLDISRQIDNRRDEGLALGNLGAVAQNLGNLSLARQYYQQAVQIHRQVQMRDGEGQILRHLGRVAATQENYAEALDFFEQALQISCEIGNQIEEGNALNNIGEAWLGLGELDKATSILEKAVSLRQGLGQEHLVMDSRSNLAFINLTQGELASALLHVDTIINYMKEHRLDGSEEPLRVYWLCYKVLQANQDPRASQILETAHSLLQERASKISDEADLKNFLENIPWHLEIIKEYSRPSTDK